MATEIASVYVSVIPSTRGIRKSLQTQMIGPAGAAGSAAGAASGSSFSKAFTKSVAIGKSLTKNVTLPVVALGGLAFNASKKFGEGMSNVATLLPNARKRVDELAGSVQDMAVRTGKSTTDLTGGLYETVSAFGDTADTAKILEVNARSARAGLATTTDAIKLTSGVTKAYGDTSAGAVTKASDLALMTVRLGQTTFPELASSMGKVVPIAESVGQSQEEVFATFATLTGVTGSAAEVATQYRGVLAGLINPTESLNTLLEAQGYESGEAALNQLGLVDTMKLIKTESERTGKPITDYISSIESVPAALALAGPQADAYTEKLREMGKAQGTTDVAFREATTGVNEAGFAWDQAKAKGEVLLQKLGAGLAPALTSVFEASGPVVDKITALAGRFESASPATQRTIVKLIALAAAAGPVLVVLGKLGSAAVKVYDGTTKVASGVSKAASAMKSGYQAVHRFGEGFRSAQVAQSAFSGKAGTLGGKVRSIASAMGSGAKDAASWAAAQAKAGAAATRSAASFVAQKTATIASTVAQRAAAAATWLLNAAMNANPITLIVIAIVALVAALFVAYKNVDWFRAAVDAAWQGIQTAIAFAWNSVIKPVFGALAGFVTGILIPIIKAYLAVWKFVFTLVWAILQDAWDIILSIFTALVAFIVSVLVPIFTTIWATVKTVFGAVSAAIAFAWNSIIRPVFAAISGFVTGTLVPMFQSFLAAVQVVWAAVQGAISAAWGVVSEIFRAIVSFIRDQLTARFRDFQNLTATVWSAVHGAVSSAWSIVKGVFEAIVSFVTGTLVPVWSKVSDAVSSAFGAIPGAINGALRTAGDIVSGFMRGVSNVADAIGLGNIRDALRSGASKADGWGEGNVSPQRRGGAYGLARGGRVHGGVRGKDSVPLWGMPGEFMQRVSAVRKWGLGAMSSLNAGRVPAGWSIPGFKDGGEIVRAGAEALKFRSGFDKVKDFGGSLLDKARAIAAGALEKLWPEMGVPSNLLGFPAGGYNSLRSNVLDKIRGRAKDIQAAETAKEPRGGGFPGSTTGIVGWFMDRFKRYSAAVGGLSITSGFRSIKKQAILYARYLAGKGNLAARPGTSKHEKGLAIDHAPRATAAMKAIARGFGLHYPVPGEPWHVEPFAKGGPVTAHSSSFDTGGVLAPGWNVVRNDTGGPEDVRPGGDRAALQIANFHAHDGVDIDLVLQKVGRRVMAGAL